VQSLAEPLPDPADDPSGELAASVINRAMERLVLQCPEQYLWGYNRYKAPRAQAAATTATSG